MFLKTSTKTPVIKNGYWETLFTLPIPANDLFLVFGRIFFCFVLFCFVLFCFVVEKEHERGSGRSRGRESQAGSHPAHRAHPGARSRTLRLWPEPNQGWDA